MYSSEKLVVKTHKMTDLSGITVTPGILPQQLRDSLDGAIDRIGAKLAETVRIDTTHFVCTEGRGPAWEKATDMNIPIVRPEWVEGCEREGRIVGVRGYYLNADPKLRQVGQGVGMQQQQQGQSRPQQLQRTDTSSTLQRQSQPGTPRQMQTPRTTQSTLSAESPRPQSTASSEGQGPTVPEKDTPAPRQQDEEDESEGEDEEGDVGDAEEKREGGGVDEDEDADEARERGLGVTDEKGEEIPPKTPAESLSNFSEVAL